MYNIKFQSAAAHRRAARKSNRYILPKPHSLLIAYFIAKSYHLAHNLFGITIQIDDIHFFNTMIFCSILGIPFYYIPRLVLQKISPAIYEYLKGAIIH